MSDNKQDDSQDLESLRLLLLGTELEKLEKLSRRVDVPENFSSAVGDVLPQAIIKSSRQGEQLSEAMVPTVEEIVRLSIKNDINKFADALFPVIGPAIRKSITESFRQMLQSLNQTLEQSFSWQGVKWRLESMRTGIPIAQITLLHGLVYRVEQVFLIHCKTGLLLQHIEQEDLQTQNADMVSSMLSAINDFVGDSFEIETNRTLGAIEVGDLSIWIEQGPSAILAVAVRGEAPNSMRTTIQLALEKIHSEFAEALTEFSGDTSEFEQSREILADCMQAQYKSGDNKTSPKTIIVWLLVALVLLYWVGTEIHQSMLQKEYVASLENEPGYVITNVLEKRGVLGVKGLRDPLSRDPSVLLVESALSAAEVSHDFEYYQSLEQEFVTRRAGKILQAPKGVTLSIDGDVLQIKGIASEEWQANLDSVIPMIAGINSYDISGLKKRFNPAMLDPPDGVSMQLESGVLVVTGRAGNDWIMSLESAIQAHEEISSINIDSLLNLTEAALAGDVAALQKEMIFFDAATASEFATMDTGKISALVKSIIDKAGELSRRARIVVRGYADSSGSYEDNVILSLGRADQVAKNLILTGIDPAYFDIRGLETPVEKESNEDERRYNRRVSFEVVME